MTSPFSSSSIMNSGAGLLGISTMERGFLEMVALWVTARNDQADGRSITNNKHANRGGDDVDIAVVDNDGEDGDDFFMVMLSLLLQCRRVFLKPVL